jgi:segregation and condensation protein A
MLLPRVADTENNEDDPRAELVRRLQEYERYKQAAEDIDKLCREERDVHVVNVDDSNIEVDKPLPHVAMTELMSALLDVLKRVELNASHQVHIDALSVREKMTMILERIQSDTHCSFGSLFNLKEGRLGVVVTFLAMLELLKQSLLDFVQAEPFAPIYLKTKAV